MNQDQGYHTKLYSRGHKDGHRDGFAQGYEEGRTAAYKHLRAELDDLRETVESYIPPWYEDPLDETRSGE